MRLIDADKILDKLSGMIKIMDDYDAVKKVINDMPTDYDIDKVVKELEKELSLADKEKERCTGKNHLQFDSAKGYASGISTAIEIVKQGGISDDVCDWKSASDGEFIQNPHTKRLYSNEPSMQNVYCNTCGKKIKVVD